jgi:hypothetical protein
VLKRAAAKQLGVAPMELPAWVVLSSAGLGGICYWLAIFPVDCIKSAMQTDTIIRGQRRYTDIPTTAKVGRRGGGVRGPPLGVRGVPNEWRAGLGPTDGRSGGSARAARRTTRALRLTLCLPPLPRPLTSSLQQLLWGEGGIKRFYKGFTPCLIRAAPANAAMLFTVDRVTAALSSK